MRASANNNDAVRSSADLENLRCHRLIIRDFNPSLDEPLYWNNEDGWGDRVSATTFTIEESASYLLPGIGTQPKWVNASDMSDTPHKSRA